MGQPLRIRLRSNMYGVPEPGYRITYQIYLPKNIPTELNGCSPGHTFLISLSAKGMKWVSQ